MKTKRIQELNTMFKAPKNAPKQRKPLFERFVLHPMTIALKRVFIYYIINYYFNP